MNRLLYAATGNSTHGYFGGGKPSPSGPITSMDKTTYSTDTTVAVPGANLSVARSSMGATKPTHGYFNGGRDNNNASLSSVEKVTMQQIQLPYLLVQT